MAKKASAKKSASKKKRTAAQKRATQKMIAANKKKAASKKKSSARKKRTTRTTPRRRPTTRIRGYATRTRRKNPSTEYMSREYYVVRIQRTQGYDSPIRFWDGSNEGAANPTSAILYPNKNPAVQVAQWLADQQGSRSDMTIHVARFSVKIHRAEVEKIK